MKLNIREHLQGAGCAMFEDPARRERWGFLTDNLAESCRGYTRTDKDAVQSKRWMMEALLDNTLRTIGSNEDGPVVLDRSAIPIMMESVVEGKPVEIDEATTMGWTSPSVVPSTAKIFTTQALGMVRRVFPRMIATDLISVQPISQPTGKVFYLDIKYGVAGAGGIAVNDRVDDPTAWTFAGERDYASYVNTDGTNTTAAMGENVSARTVNLDLSSIDVTSESKKLAAEWSIEAQQDLRAYHGLDADGELTAATAAEITREIDRTLINFIFTTARDSGAGNTYWNKNGYAGSLPSEQKAWDETLWDAIEDAATDIEAVRYRRPTWLLLNHNTAQRIRKLNGFRSLNVGNSDGSTDLQIQTGGRRLYGTIQDTFYIYVDPWFDDDQIVLGYKGNAFFETGIVYSPYIPFYRTPLFTNPLTFYNQRGVMSRFAKTAVVPQMYARLQINAS